MSETRQPLGRSAFARLRTRGMLTLTVAALAAAGLTFSGSLLGSAPFAHAAPEAPSWDDVEAAKNDAAKQQELVGQLTSLVQQLDSEAQSAATDARRAEQAYAEAYQNALAAQAELDGLSAQLDAAKKQAGDSKTKAGVMAAGLQRTPANDSLNVFFAGDDARDMLGQMKTGAQLSKEAQRAYEVSQNDANSVDSLTKQASVVRDERDRLEQDAQAKQQAARDAAANAQQKLRSSETQKSDATDKLAALNNTAKDVEAAYVAHQIELERQRQAELERQRQAAAAAAEAERIARENARNNANTGGGGGGSSTGGGNSGGGGGSYNPAPVPGTNAAQKIEIAVAYAMAQVGKGYALASRGPYYFDCTGLTWMAYSQAGLDIGGYNVSSQYANAAAKGQLVSLGNRERGDLIYWGRGPGDFDHIALYLGNGWIVEAASTDLGVITERLWGSPFPYASRPTA